MFVLFKKFIYAGILAIFASALFVLLSTQHNCAATSFELSIVDHVEFSGPVKRAAQLSKEYAEFSKDGRQRGFLPSEFFLIDKSNHLIRKSLKKICHQLERWQNSALYLNLHDRVSSDQHPNRFHRKKLPEIILPCGK